MRRGLTRKQKGRGCGCGGMEILGFPKTGGFTSLFGGEEEELTEGGLTRQKPFRPKANMSIQSSPVIPAQESSPVIPAQTGEVLPSDSGQSGDLLPNASGQSGDILSDSSSSILPSTQEMRKNIQQKQKQPKQMSQQFSSGPITYNSVKPSQGSPRGMPSKLMDQPMDNISPEMNSEYTPKKKSRASISKTKRPYNNYNSSFKQKIPSFEQAAPFIQKELMTMRQDINILKNKISRLQSSSGGPSRGLFGGRRKTLRRIRKHRG